MSGQLAMVLAHSRARGSARLAAISLANNYEVEAHVALVSMDVLCREANLTELEAERALARLVKLGEWVVADDFMGFRAMRLVLSCPLDCDRSAAHRTSWELERTAS